MSRRRTLAVVSAGLSVAVVDPAAGRPARRGHRRRPCAGTAIDAARCEVVELREHARDLADNLVTGFPNAEPAAAPRHGRPAPTALIAVTPIFAASYSGLFKTFFDVLDEDALAGKPVLLGATAGTARHSLALDHALRPLFALPARGRGADRRVRGGGGLGRRRDQRPRRRASSGRAASSPTSSRAAPRPRPADPFADVVPFEALLRRG